VRSILCFGDSNTWGSDPRDSNRRFPRDVRWPGVLQRELGEHFFVIEEGLGGRTTVFEDPLVSGRAGLEHIVMCLETHAPLDLAIIMLGTNDISDRGVSAAAVADGAGRIVDIVQRSTYGPGNGPPGVLLLCPPPVGPVTEFAGIYAGAEEKSRELASEFRRVAELLGCEWMDLGEAVTTSPIDGWHLEAPEHGKLGLAVAAKVREILGE